MLVKLCKAHQSAAELDSKGRVAAKVVRTRQKGEVRKGHVEVVWTTSAGTPRRAAYSPHLVQRSTWRSRTPRGPPPAQASVRRRLHRVPGECHSF